MSSESHLLPPAGIIISKRSFCTGLGAALVSGSAAAALESRPVAPTANVSESALRGAELSADARNFYASRGWAPGWTAEAAADLVATLQRSEQHALQTADLESAIQAANAPADREARLTTAALSYASALARGAVDPNTVNDIYTVPRNSADVARGLERALSSLTVGAWLEGLAPTDAEYKALSAAYVEQRRQFGSLPPHVPDGPSLRLGDADPRMSSVRRTLQLKGYLAGQPPAAGDQTYDPGVHSAIRRLQQDEGIAVDGVIGPDTLWALNAGPSDKARQLALNLERWRWLERNPPGTRIDVNTAAAELVYYRGSAPALVERVVVGRPDWATPSLGAAFDRLVVNPPWNVPSSIARREILPRGSSYLRRNNMYVRGGRVIQRPGPRSALGLVKFDMRNRYAIYLHDTPSKALFETDDRHRSHGCVRVRDAVGFARRLAEEQGVGARFDRALASGRTTVVRLGEAVPVRLLYRTAFLRDGRIVYTPDPYDRDDQLAAALGMPPGKRPSRAGYSEIPLGP